MKKKTTQKKFEDNLLRLEEIASILEGESITIEDAVSLFEEGIELSRYCIASLRDAELKITELKKKLDNIPKLKNESIKE